MEESARIVSQKSPSGSESGGVRYMAIRQHFNGMLQWYYAIPRGRTVTRDVIKNMLRFTQDTMHGLIKLLSPKVADVLLRIWTNVC